jgi:hypothetical protein
MNFLRVIHRTAKKFFAMVRTGSILIIFGTVEIGDQKERG